MCGIVGYVGEKQAAPLLLKALERLEYRGYDSAGLALACGGKLEVRKTRGRLKALQEMTHDGADLCGSTGIGHTRWATHGEPSDLNAHPHLSHSGRVVLVHNGIVENYAELRAMLSAKGYTFCSETDTEIAAQLIDACYRGDPAAAVREAVGMMSGSFALGILFADHPDMLLATRKDSPLIVGLGEGENFIASDVPAILSHTREIIRLDEYDMAVLTKDKVEVYDRYGQRTHKQTQHIEWDAAAAEKGGYAHFMIKEIMEQPAVIRDTVHPRIQGGKLKLELTHISDEDLRDLTRIYVVACGSACHVGHLLRNYIERYARIPVDVELASEFRYLDPLMGRNTLVIVISQSGETLDTLLALREAKQKGARILSIVNVVGSSIASDSEDVLYTWAGPEIAVATTKAYSAQLALGYLLSLHIARCRGQMSDADVAQKIEPLALLPGLMEAVLERREAIQYLASLYYGCKDIFFIGRNMDHAVALEGSLKLKEISYIHSEAYAAGELKHGTISLIEEGSLVIALCTYSPLRDKMISNIREVKARGAVVLAIAEEGAPLVEETADHTVFLPKSDPLLRPSLTILPLQLFAYYVALLKGCDIDKPRNLAKSVTVE